MKEINKMRERKEIKEKGPECHILMSAYLGSSQQ
jgi:hypothetical protein